MYISDCKLDSKVLHKNLLQSLSSFIVVDCDYEMDERVAVNENLTNLTCENVSAHKGHYKAR
jgi:hypothetical protein